MALRGGALALRAAGRSARPRVHARTIFGGPDQFEVSRAIARRTRFDAVLRALGRPLPATRAAVEIVLEAALRKHAPAGSLGSAEDLRAAVADALPRLSSLQTAPFTRTVTTTEIAAAAADHAPAASRAAIASEHQAALAAAREMAPGDGLDRRAEQAMMLPHRKPGASGAAEPTAAAVTAAEALAPPAAATPAEVYASGTAPAAQHNAAVAALAAGASRPAPHDPTDSARGGAEGTGKHGAGDQVGGKEGAAEGLGGEAEPPVDVLTAEEMVTVHALRTAAALAALQHRPWGALRITAAEVATVGGGSSGGGGGAASGAARGGAGISVEGVLELTRSLSAGETLRAVQAQLRLSRAVTAATGPPTPPELEAACRAAAAAAAPLVLHLLPRTTLLQASDETDALAALGRPWWRRWPFDLLSRTGSTAGGPRPSPGASTAAGPAAPAADAASTAEAATAILLSEMARRPLPLRAWHRLTDPLLRSRSAAPPPLLAHHEAAVHDTGALAAALDAEARSNRRLAPLFRAVQSEPDLTRALARAFYSRHVRMAARRRRGAAALRLLGLFVAGNMLDFFLTNF
jgi:hypothetical protein